MIRILVTTVVLLLVAPLGALASPPEQPAVPPEAPGTRSLQNSPAWTVDGDQTSAYLSDGISTAGDVNGDGYSDVLVAAPWYDNGELDEGKVWLYLGSPTGLSSSPAWTAEGNQASAHFGSSVATAGDVNGDGYDDVIVGADGYDGGQTDEGRAYLFLGSASGLSATPSWTAEGNQAGASFGCSVATAGDVNGDGYDDVIIGAFRYDNGETDEGVAFVYRGNATHLGDNPVWTGEGNAANASYGYAVGTAGDVNGDGRSDIIVGAFGLGRASVYLGNASGVNVAAIWVGIGDAGAGSYGQSVSTAGDVDGDGYSDVTVGAPQYANPESGEGKVYVYHGSATGVSASPDWTAEGNQAGAAFGWAVSLAGDTNGDGFSDVIIGASGYSNGQTGEGRAFLYQGSTYGLESTAAWYDESDQANARYGRTVACAGDVDGDGLGDVLVGAPYYDNGQNQEGRAYLYRGITGDVAGTASWTMESNQAEARFGWSVAFAGDVNGDGFGDVLIGAQTYDNGQVDEGRAQLHMGGRAGVYNYVSWSGEGNQSGALYGTSVAGAGDVNGDGYDDIIVGAPGYDHTLTGEGQVFVYLGSAAGVSPTPSWTYAGGQASAAFGWSVASAGDVNGDGYGDVIVGAINYDSGQINEGGAFLFLGSAAGLGAAPAWIAEGGQAGVSFGHSVACAGDINGDGYSDVIVGAPGYTNGESSEGRAFVFLGSAGGLSPVPAWTAESNQASANFGFSVAGAGDVNGDGYSDVLVGDPDYDNSEIDEGRVSVFLGGSGGLATSPAWTRYGLQAGAHLGYSVAGAGDVNADGRSDIVLGAVYYDNPNVDEGAAYLFLGTAAGPSTSAAWEAEGNQDNAGFGIAVDGSGDVNGDGFSDLFIGAFQYTNAQTREGWVFFYYGNEGDGLDRTPGQRRADDTAIIPLLGKSESTSSFRLTMRGRTPAGRGKVQMVWEVKPLGIPFDGSDLVLGNLTDTGVPVPNIGSSVALGELSSGLNLDTPYHWRLRVRTHSPFFPRSPWLSHPGNNRTETDLRTGGSSSSVEDGGPAVADPPILRAHPNPFRSRTVLAFSLPVAGATRISILDAQGRRMAVLVDETLEAGPHTVIWNGSDDRGGPLGAGVYFARCEAPGFVRSVKIILKR